MLNIFSSRSKDESSENIAVVTEQVEEENEFNYSARILSDRIALTEVRIQNEIDSLLKDLSPCDFAMELNTVRQGSLRYRVLQSVVKIKISL